MKLLRWLGVLGCLCLFALAAQADPTICTFSGSTADTPYTQYATQGNPGFVFMGGGPPGNPNFYRLTFSGVGSTNAEIAFDLTAPGPTAHVIVDFDFRITGAARRRSS